MHRYPAVLGGRPYGKTESGQLPIHFAASAQQPASLSLLLQAGNSANARDKDGITPLMNAVQPAIWLPTAKKCVELLLSYGAEASARDKVFGWTALPHLADFPLTFIKQEGGGSVYNLEQQEHLHIEVARVLIAAGCDPSQKDVAGRTAADIALRQGSVRIAEFLRKYERSKVGGRSFR
ncbi:MAG: ankyrin repeat domain-containing protein [Chthonomonadetes bacterium]|nr:ankyrin repeat domain-containing protein [Chthonomonadetes bacterium]